MVPWDQFLGFRTEGVSGLADAFQATLHRVAHEAVQLEIRLIHALDEDSIRSAFSTMSAKLSAGSYLEGILPVSVDIHPQPVFFDRFGRQIHRATKQFGQPFFQADELEKVDMRFPVQFNQKVDIAVWSGFAACHGPEQGQTADAGRAQFGFMRPQCRQNLVSTR
jgi:hypothetical protein